MSRNKNKNNNNSKAKQVYLNTLAVYVGKDYLVSLDFEACLDDKALLSIFFRMNKDVADVIIPGLGTIEFRYVLPGETSFSIPNPDKKEVIAYVAVAFDDSLDFVDILGFIVPKDLLEPKVDMIVCLDNLQPAEKLLNYLSGLETNNLFN